jgi:cysteinyl-tRNA synthetase
LRFIYVSSQYRSIAEVSDDSVKAAESAISRLREARREIIRKLETASDGNDTALDAKIAGFRLEFETAMDDDFNTPEALAALFGLTREMNGAGKVGRGTLLKALAAFDDLGEGVLGLFPAGSDNAGGMSEELLGGLLEIAIDARKTYRLNRDFHKSDALRERLKELGVQLEDTVEGTRWKLG